MNEKISQLLAQMAELEAQLVNELQQRESTIQFTFKGKKVQFEDTVAKAHRALRKSLWKWVTTNRPQNLLTGPVIYAMAVPMVLVDACVTFYQAVCFPVYGIAKVRRSDYFQYDRQRLGYLNVIEKFHCTYCAYGNGLMAYMTEILARTEQYFCPIKHAHRVVGMHSRYRHFLEFGQADHYAEQLEANRVQLNQERADQRRGSQAPFDRASPHNPPKEPSASERSEP